MAGGVHQVELVGFAVFRGIVEADGLGFDGNAAFALNVHGIEHLFLRRSIRSNGRPGSIFRGRCGR